MLSAAAALFFWFRRLTRVTAQCGAREGSLQLEIAHQKAPHKHADCACERARVLARSYADDSGTARKGSIKERQPGKPQGECGPEEESPAHISL